MNRRDFLKLHGAGSLAVAAGGLGAVYSRRMGVGGTPNVKGDQIGTRRSSPGRLPVRQSSTRWARSCAIEEDQRQGRDRWAEGRDGVPRLDHQGHEAIKNARYFVDSWGRDSLPASTCLGQCDWP